MNVKICQPNSAHDEILGAGFLLGSQVAITAAHCVSTITDTFTNDNHRFKTGDVKIAATTNAGNSISLKATYVADEITDIAIITFEDETFRLDSLVIHRTDDIPRGANWQVKSIFHSMPTIEGIVTDPRKDYCLASAETIVTIQLRCKTLLDTHEGYSGSALQLENGRHPWPVAGMLVEQYINPGESKKAANILFALSIETIVDSNIYNYVSFKGVGVTPPRKNKYGFHTKEPSNEDLLEQTVERRIQFLQKHPTLPADVISAYIRGDIKLTPEVAGQ